MRTTMRVYHTIRQHIEHRGFPPTAEEIASLCNLSLAQVEAALERLARRGQIIRLPGKARGMRLPEMDRRWWVEEQVYAYLRGYSQRSGQLPSLHQIARGCGLSLETVFGYVYQLHVSGRLHGLPVGGLSSLFTAPIPSASAFA